MTGLQRFVHSGTTPPVRSPVAYVAFEAVLIVAAYFVYFLVRGATEGSRADAYENADRVIAFQEAIGIDWEVTIQSWSLGNQLLVDAANWVYIWGHWPVIALVALWLVLFHPADYRLVRNAFLLSGGIGLVIFATFPLAPPRFVDIGVIDTVTEHSNAYRVLQPPALVNEYAAMPSLHFGWNLLVGIVLAWKARHVALRVIGIMLPPLMLWSVVATGNHFVIDAVAGAAVALVGLWLALWLRRSTWTPPPFRTPARGRAPG